MVVMIVLPRSQIEDELNSNNTMRILRRIQYSSRWWERWYLGGRAWLIGAGRRGLKPRAECLVVLIIEDVHVCSCAVAAPSQAFAWSEDITHLRISKVYLVVCTKVRTMYELSFEMCSILFWNPTCNNASTRH